MHAVATRPCWLLGAARRAAPPPRPAAASYLCPRRQRQHGRTGNSSGSRVRFRHGAGDAADAAAARNGPPAHSSSSTSSSTTTSSTTRTISSPTSSTSSSSSSAHAAASTTELLPGLPIAAADLACLERASKAWDELCARGGRPAGPPRQVLLRHAGAALDDAAAADSRFDVVVLGGTLGVLYATALLAEDARRRAQQHGHQYRQQQRPPLRVAVVERGAVAGREQEFNASRSDLAELARLGVLAEEALRDYNGGGGEMVVVTRCAGARVGVAGRAELLAGGAMDRGVSPAALVRLARRRFEALGGVVLEHAAFERADVYDDVALVRLNIAAAAAAPSNGVGSHGGEARGAGSSGAAFAADAGNDNDGNQQRQQQQQSPAGHQRVLSARLIVDALGGLSPLAAQARGADARPESAMLLVGSCVGLPLRDSTSTSSSENSSSIADVLWADAGVDALTHQQVWWERFPADGGAAVTTYAFCFTDPAPLNAGLLPRLLRRYAAELPARLFGADAGPGAGAGATEATAGLTLRRLLVGVVPVYAERAPPASDRVLPVGDAAGNRSALSLAGFSSLLRHLGRLTAGALEALDAGALTRGELALLQPWCPGVAASLAMQRSMAVYAAQRPRLATSRDTRDGAGAGDGAAAAAADAAGTAAGGGDPAVLDAMGASLAAMAAAASPADVAAFVSDRLRFAPLWAAVRRQVFGDARQLPQLVAYSAFMGDNGRAAGRLAVGLAGLGAYTLLHAAAQRGGLGALHEALLAGRPRLLYRWRRAADAWRYGSGLDGADEGDDATTAARAGAEEQEATGDGPAAACSAYSTATSASTSTSSSSSGGSAHAAVGRRVDGPMLAAAGPQAPPVWGGSARLLLPQRSQPAAARRRHRRGAVRAAAFSPRGSGADGDLQRELQQSWQQHQQQRQQQEQSQQLSQQLRRRRPARTLAEKRAVVADFLAGVAAARRIPLGSLTEYSEPATSLDDAGAGAADVAALLAAGGCPSLFDALGACSGGSEEDFGDAYEIIDWGDDDDAFFANGGGNGGGSEEQGGGGDAAADTGSGGGGGGSGGAAAPRAVGGRPAAPGRAAARVAVWGGSLCRRAAAAPQPQLRCTGAGGSGRAAGRRAVARAAPEDRQQQPLERHFDGAEADDQPLHPPGSLDDPGHPLEERGDDDSGGSSNAMKPSAAAPPSAGKERGGAGGGSDTTEARPFVRFAGGKWQPPSKAEAEAMLARQLQCGTDEGV